jgi:hypothetical protein
VRGVVESLPELLGIAGVDSPLDLLRGAHEGTVDTVRVGVVDDGDPGTDGRHQQQRGREETDDEAGAAAEDRLTTDGAGGLVGVEPGPVRGPLSHDQPARILAFCAANSSSVRTPASLNCPSFSSWSSMSAPPAGSGAGGGGGGAA